MLTACFDASGHEADQEFLVVAGFVSSAEDWNEFSMRWSKRLAQDGIPCFHAVSCEKNNDEFWGWKEKTAEKRRLKEDLIDIIQSCTYRVFASTVQIKTLSELSDENRIEYGMRAYALAGRTCAARIREWGNSFHCRYVPEIVFEEGDAGSKELTTRMIEDGFSEPIFRPKRDRTDVKTGQARPGFIPLQAADFLAYEIFQVHKTRSIDRWEVQALLRKPGPLGTYSVKNMQRLEQMLSMRTEELQRDEGEDTIRA